MSPRLAATLALLACGALLAAVFLGACASSQAPGASMSPPSSPAEGRQQLEELEGRIARDRVALGLAPRAPRPAADAARQEGADTAAGATHEAKPAPAPAPAEEPAAAPARVTASKSRGEEEDAMDARCSERGPCRYTRAICSAAERICVIAAYLADDDARRRCARARQDCTEARETTRATCPGC